MPVISYPLASVEPAAPCVCAGNPGLIGGAGGFKIGAGKELGSDDGGAPPGSTNPAKVRLAEDGRVCAITGKGHAILATLLDGAC